MTGSKYEKSDGLFTSDLDRNPDLVCRKAHS